MRRYLPLLFLLLLAGGTLGPKVLHTGSVGSYVRYTRTFGTPVPVQWDTDKEQEAIIWNQEGELFLLDGKEARLLPDSFGAILGVASFGERIIVVEPESVHILDKNLQGKPWPGNFIGPPMIVDQQAMVPARDGLKIYTENGFSMLLPIPSPRVSTGDVNGDGKSEIAITSGNSIYLLESSKPSLFIAMNGWPKENIPGTLSTPVIGHGKVAVATSQGELRVWDTRGKDLMRKKTDQSSVYNDIPAPLFIDNMVVFTTTEGQVHAFEEGYEPIKWLVQLDTDELRFDPIAVDVEGDSRPEILVPGTPKLYLISPDGSVLEKYWMDGAVKTPILLDLLDDGTDRLEALVISEGEAARPDGSVLVFQTLTDIPTSGGAMLPIEPITPIEPIDEKNLTDGDVPTNETGEPRDEEESLLEKIKKLIDILIEKIGTGFRNMVKYAKLFLLNTGHIGLLDGIFTEYCAPDGTFSDTDTCMAECAGHAGCEKVHSACDEVELGACSEEHPNILCSSCDNPLICSKPNNTDGDSIACNCDCGGYDLPEEFVYGNCGDGIDNDCDGQIDDDYECLHPRLKIFFLPLNYESADDSDFLERVEIYKNFSIEYTPLKESDFEIIDKPVIFSQWSVGQAEGLKTILRICNLEFKKKYGYKLPQKFTYENEQMFGSFSVHRYFVVALDKIVPSVPPDACGSATCAFTSSIYPIMYISAHECGRAPHAIVHEMGHHAGLCDEYKKCRWDVQNESRLGNRGVGCLNSRPDPTNSDCVSDECPKCGGVCLGKYADTKESGYFNIMGSAGIPPPRRLSSESKEIIYTYLCNYLGVCDNE